MIPSLVPHEAIMKGWLCRKDQKLIEGIHTFTYWPALMSNDLGTSMVILTVPRSEITALQRLILRVSRSTFITISAIMVSSLDEDYQHSVGGRDRAGDSKLTIPTNDRLMVFTESATPGAQGFSCSAINVWRIYTTSERAF